MKKIDLKSDDVPFLIVSGNGTSMSEVIHINKLSNILTIIYKKIYIIYFSNYGKINNSMIENSSPLMTDNVRILSFFIDQFKISIQIIKLNKKYNIKKVLFCFGQDLKILPLITAKILNLKIFLRSDGRYSTYLLSKNNFNSKIFGSILKKLEGYNFLLVDQILTENHYMASSKDFVRYQAKIAKMPIDTRIYYKNKKIIDRKIDVAFIGRLEEEKGVYNFIESLFCSSIKMNILILGSGGCQKNVQNEIQKLNNDGKHTISIISRVPMTELPYIYNDIKIIILPSHREGLPNTMLEGMACGCVIVGSNIGGIPGEILNGENGFLINDISPRSISNTIENCLLKSNLEKISINASEKIIKEFAREQIIDDYLGIFNS